jgi:general nucleoside transport system ATP-binding protein
MTIKNILEMRNIVKTFPGVIANNHVDYSVETGEIHALLGENGAGKTTLMNVLYGLYGRDSGDILFEGKDVDIRSPEQAISLGIGMVHQEFMLVKPFTVAENVALGLDAGSGPFLDMETVREKIINLSEKYGLAVDPDSRVEHLSVGVQQRAEIVKLLVRDARLLILDEPTAVLTPQEIDGLMEILRSLVRDGRSVVFITHKLNEVMSASDRVTVLRDGKVVATTRTKDTNTNELARMMVGREVIFRTARQELDIGEVVLEIQDLHAVDEKGNPALHGITFQIREGEILGMAGVSGNGQSELAEVIAGLREVKKGQVTITGEDATRISTHDRYGMGMSYVPADRREVGCVQSLAIEKNSILGRLDEFVTGDKIFLDDKKIQQHAEDLVSRFDVRTPHVGVHAGKLSGGNLQKLILGRELGRSPKVLVIEQPTRGLDVGAIEYVHARILDARKERAGVLLISAELDEIFTLSDRIAVIYEGEIMGFLQPDEVDIELIGLMMAGTRKEEALVSAGSKLIDDDGLAVRGVK